jgi:2,3-bisphosphoglycerate-independent phosphoglycerate mutase
MLGRVPTVSDPSPGTDLARCLPLDATLGVAGHPQSGTGQTSLFTGLNGAQLFGRHFGPWTPVKLRAPLGERNLMKRAQDEGRTVAFANAYPKGYPQGVSTRRQAATTLAALSVGALYRHHQDLKVGRAVASGIVNTGWRRGLGYEEVPQISAQRAGENLARVSETADLTVFAHYDTDHVGHEGTLEECVVALERVDRFFGGLIEALSPETALVVASDHGNIEEWGGSHTRNPVMGVLYRGAGAPELARPTDSIMGVASLVLTLLGIPDA